MPNALKVATAAFRSLAEYVQNGKAASTRTRDQCPLFLLQKH